VEGASFFTAASKHFGDIYPMNPATCLSLGSICLPMAIFCFAWLGLSELRAHEAIGGDVRIVSTIDSGGLVQTGGDVQINGFVGEPGTVAAGGDVVVRQGGNSMIYYAAGFSVQSVAATINESGTSDADSTRTPLRGRVVYDDATFGEVDGALVMWRAPSPESALASISAEGIAQAATVYEDSVASFAGSYAGLSASNNLTVLNLLPDNYREWAGDTFDDAWEIAQGMTRGVDPNATNNGVLNWQLYAMGFNPEKPAPASLSIPVMSDGYLAVAYTRNPFAIGYLFAPQEAANLSDGFSNMIAPVSVTNSLPDGNQQIITRGSQPMSSVRRQFLRIRITPPAP
jgi:hypothetical protein